MRKKKRFGDLGGIWPEFELFACLTWSPKPSCPVLTGWHHHFLISSRSFHRLMDKAVGKGSGWQWGLGPVVQLRRLCLLSVVLEQHPIKSQHGHSGSSKRERGKKTWGQRENRRRGGEGGRGGAMSCLWPERREGPRDMTDYRRGQSSRPMPRPQLSVMGAGRGMWGTERGRKQERQVLVKERGGKKEKRRKEKNTLWKDSATKCPGLCGSLFLQMLPINYKTHHSASTHFSHVPVFTL